MDVAMFRFPAMRPPASANAREMWRVLLSVGLLSLMPVVADAGDLKNPSRAHWISRAVFANGQLWLLTDDGNLSTIAPGAKRRVAQAISDHVLDLCQSDGVVQVLTCPRDGCATWTLRKFSGDHWHAVKSLPSKGDTVVAAQCDRAGEMTVLSRTRLVELSSRRSHAVSLSDRLPDVPFAATLGSSADVLIGINGGEWAGGLRRIERRSGKIDTLDQRGSEGCIAEINECGPVTAIVDDPWKDHCVIVAIGIVHFVSQGRIDEVCVDGVHIFWSRYLPPGRSDPILKAGKRPLKTEAFFGLARSGSSLFAIGLDGVYRFEARGKPKIIPLPEFESIDGVSASFAQPDVVLVMRGVNQRRSDMWPVPMLVPR